MLHHVNVGLSVKQCVHQIPSITMEASIQPITRTVLRVRLIVMPDFRWNDQVNFKLKALKWVEESFFWVFLLFLQFLFAAYQEH